MAFGFTAELIAETGHFFTTPDGKYVKEYRDVWRCKCPYNFPLDMVCSELGVLPGAPYRFWSFATAHSIVPAKMPSVPPHNFWEVVIDYSTEGVVPDDPSDTDPVLRRVKRRTGTTQQQRFIIKDKNDVLITDAARSAFDGGIPVTDYLGTFIFERDEIHSEGSMSQAAILSGQLNSILFAGCDPETLMLDVTGEEKWEGGYHFWTFTYTMTHDPLGWQPRPLNAGLYQLVSGRRQRILEADGTKTQEPQPLYADSFTVPPPGTVIPENRRPDDCRFVEVDHYDTFDFATLGLTAL